MDTEDLKKKLANEGFAHVYEWTDAPNTVYEEHAHKGKVTLYIVKGSVEMNMGNEVQLYKSGDKIDVPVGIPHTAKVGPEGCMYIIGEEIEGDS